jgi:hypothetical protein
LAFGTGGKLDDAQTDARPTYIVQVGHQAYQ